MPNLLYIDTSATVATVALSAGGSIKTIRTHENANEQAAVLNSLIAQVLEEAACSLDLVAAICVCAGPGSYTGLRVGMSTAKGIAYVKDIPLMLFNRLDLLAWSQNRTAPFAIAIKARAEEYFFATYTATGDQQVAPHHAFEADIVTSSEPDMLFITDDIDFSVAEPKEIVDFNNTLNMDRWITRAEVRFATGKFDDLAYSEPFYLKGAYTTQSKK